MLIRSQGKSFLINPDNYKAIAIEPSGKVVITNVLSGDDHVYYMGHKNDYADGVVLGQYSTIEKARKVLDMISDAYSSCLYHHGRMREFETEDYKPSQWAYVPEFAFIPPSVFQMPLDSEVEGGTE